jgi:hypothetical protein
VVAEHAPLLGHLPRDLLPDRVALEFTQSVRDLDALVFGRSYDTHHLVGGRQVGTREQVRGLIEPASRKEAERRRWSATAKVNGEITVPPLGCKRAQYGVAERSLPHPSPPARMVCTRSTTKQVSRLNEWISISRL